MIEMLLGRKRVVGMGEVIEEFSVSQTELFRNDFSSVQLPLLALKVISSSGYLSFSYVLPDT